MPGANRVGRQIADLVFAADIDGAGFICAQGAHRHIGHINDAPARAIVLDDTGMVADVDDAPLVLGKSPV